MRPFRAPARRGGKGAEEDALRVPHWAVAVLAMGGLHLLWLIWLVPLPAHERMPYRPPTKFAFLSAAADGLAGGGDPNGNARALWSPILLSLPTPMGFSGAVVSDELDVQPALDAPLGRARFLERESYAAPDPDPGRYTREVALIARSPQPELTLPDRRLPEPSPGFSLRFADKAEASLLTETPWPTNTVAAATDWMLAARLVLGEDGRVQSVFIEEPAAEPAANRHAVRALRRWRGVPGAEGRSARVRLSHVAAPGGAVARGEDGAP